MSDEWPQGDQASQKDGSEKTERDWAGARTKRNTWIYRVTVAVLAVTLLVTYVRKKLTESDLEDQIRSERVQFTKHVSSALAAQAEELLRLDVLALTAALEPVLQRNEVGAMQEFIETLVKEQYVSSISVADESGTIVAATNKKWQGASLQGVFPGAPAAGKQVAVRRDGDSFVAAGPVMHDGQRIGTVVLLYASATVSDRLPEPARR